MTMERDDWQFPWAKGWPEIDRSGMVEVDRRMVETYGIALEKMMENAGRALATVAWCRWFVGARRLAAWGACVEIVLAHPATALAPVPAGQFVILVGMGIAVVEQPPDRGDLILDGLVGDLYRADISVPPTLYSGMACPIVTPSFAGEDILRIT